MDDAEPLRRAEALEEAMRLDRAAAALRRLKPTGTPPAPASFDWHEFRRELVCAVREVLKEQRGE